MPTYKNNSTLDHQMRNLDNNLIRVEPTESIETYYLYDLANVTLIAATPYFNPVALITQPASIGAGDDTTITLGSKTDILEVFNNSSYDITIFLTALANTPGIIVPAGTLRNIRDLYERVAAVIIQFAGAVTAGEVIITELEEVA